MKWHAPKIYPNYLRTWIATSAKNQNIQFGLLGFFQVFSHNKMFTEKIMKCIWSSNCFFLGRQAKSWTFVNRNFRFHRKARFDNFVTPLQKESTRFYFVDFCTGTSDLVLLATEEICATSLILDAYFAKICCFRANCLILSSFMQSQLRYRIR